MLAGATDIITANTEVATEMGSQLLGYLGAHANGVRILVRELRKQMDNHVVELAEELMSDTQHLPKDPDGYVYKVDQKLLSSAVRLLNPPLMNTPTRLEGKGLEGGPYKWWNLWFSSKECAKLTSPWHILPLKSRCICPSDIDLLLGGAD